MKNAAFRAHTNIALIKYWGKEDETLFIPMNSSLSLTLNELYTDTFVSRLDEGAKDSFILNNHEQSEEETKKISKFLDSFRKEAGISSAFRVESINHVPTAAGLASSASAFAALAGAMNQVTGLQMDPQKLSTYARRGSGSSTRSLFGGFVEWQKGTSSEDSMAIPIDPADWDIGMVIVAVNKTAKKISSRLGMKQTVETSPFYPAWVSSAKDDLIAIKEAIHEHDFKRLGEITEHSAMKMHGSMLGAKRPIIYFEPDSMKAIQTVKKLREEGLLCYVTMDAGPNVKVLCRLSEAEKIKQKLLEDFTEEQVLISGPGPGIRPLTDNEAQVYGWSIR